MSADGILFVDDDRIFLRSIRKNFQRDFNISIAGSAQQALEKVAQNEFAVIVSDLKMNKIDGVQLFSNIKIEYPNTVRVLFTGYPLNIATAAINDAEVYRLLEKPSPIDKVRSVLKESLAYFSQREAERIALKKSDSIVYRERKYRKLVECVNDVICSVDLMGIINYVSPSWVENLGHGLGDVLKIPFASFLHPDDYYFLRDRMGIARQELDKHFISECRLKHKDGRWIWHSIKFSCQCNCEGRVRSFVLVCRDITLQRIEIEKIKRLSLFDQLTGLANRRLLEERIRQALFRAVRNHKNVAVLFIDLDKFKPVNDLFGHAVGDTLLQEVSIRLQKTLRHSDTIARVGGDEFVVVLEEMQYEYLVHELVEKINFTISSPYLINGNNISISCSTGACKVVCVNGFAFGCQ